jgi:hypothetical protein
MARLALVIAGCQLAGCATTGGNISLAATAVGVIGFASTFNADLFCGGVLGPCPDNTEAGVFALTALAGILTGATFELVNAMSNDRPRTARPPKPRPLDCPTIVTVLHGASETEQAKLRLDPAVAACSPAPSSLGVVEALAIAQRLATERGFHIDAQYLLSRFDSHAHTWVFDWDAPATVTIVYVTEAGVATGRECSRAETDFGGCSVSDASKHSPSR